METKKNYETGHSKNVANFQTLITFITAYGETYNPANKALNLQALNLQLTGAQTQIETVDTAKITYNLAVGSRATTFEPLKATATRLYNALKASGAPQKTIEEAKTINRKIQGTRAKKPAEGEKTISVSQQSYDSLTENYARLIDLLASEAAYQPNEKPLQVETLKETLKEIREKNIAVINTYTTYSNAQISRNAALYNKPDGLVDTALLAKEYVKSIFGATSPQYKQISKIEFKRSKD
ncbi:MAG: hypothetical protein LBR81_10105 [Prevotellaceae bacterium]|jgi:hypothetical protein|nr:hypothetical protein [Prevotellaceae bacterium]